MFADGQAGAWLGVIALGIYHGINPAMGWPLAVANGLTARSGVAVMATVLPLGAGHLLAMSVVLVPFSLLSWYVDWSRAIRIGAGLVVMLYGAYLLLQPRHPRFLARIAPTRLLWWSFLMATAHGAGLMLVPLTLGLCAPTGAHAGHLAVAASMGNSLVVAMSVALVHTAAMMACGLVLAWSVYRYLGLQFITRSWFNLDRVWALSLIVAGGAGCLLALGESA